MSVDLGGRRIVILRVLKLSKLLKSLPYPPIRSAGALAPVAATRGGVARGKPDLAWISLICCNRNALALSVGSPEMSGTRVPGAGFEVVTADPARPVVAKVDCKSICGLV